jgi:hypothetical protein
MPSLSASQKNNAGRKPDFFCPVVDKEFQFQKGIKDEDL